MFLTLYIYSKDHQVFIIQPVTCEPAQHWRTHSQVSGLTCFLNYFTSSYSGFLLSIFLCIHRNNIFPILPWFTLFPSKMFSFCHWNYDLGFSSKALKIFFIFSSYVLHNIIRNFDNYISYYTSLYTKTHMLKHTHTLMDILELQNIF